MNGPLVQVCLITYNHARYIAKALDSVLAQEVDFPWEAVVADDCSDDGTRAILVSYRDRYPDRIRLLLQPKNVGPRRNFLDLMAATSSKYLAYLEGDDYWTDPTKLQQQFDLLESNKHIAGCCAHAVVVDHNGDVVSADYHAHNQIRAKAEISTGDIVPFGISPSCTLMFRSEVLRDPPEWYLRYPRHSGLDLLITLHGVLFCFSQTFGAYRVHLGGIWSCTAPADRHVNDLLFLKGLYFDPVLRSRHEAVIRKSIQNGILSLADCFPALATPRSIATNYLAFLLLEPAASRFALLLPYWLLRHGGRRCISGIVQRAVRLWS